MKSFFFIIVLATTLLNADARYTQFGPPLTTKWWVVAKNLGNVCTENNDIRRLMLSVTRAMHTALREEGYNWKTGAKQVTDDCMEGDVCVEADGITNTGKSGVRGAKEERPITDLDEEFLCPAFIRVWEDLGGKPDCAEAAASIDDFECRVFA